MTFVIIIHVQCSIIVFFSHWYIYYNQGDENVVIDVITQLVISNCNNSELCNNLQWGVNVCQYYYVNLLIFSRIF